MNGFNVGTRVAVVDNSGAKIAQCICILDGSKRKRATIGDRIVVAIKSLSDPHGMVKSGDVSKAIVVRTVASVNRKNGESVCFGDNAVVLINENWEMKGTRVFGPVAREVRKNEKCSKILSLAAEVI